MINYCLILQLLISFKAFPCHNYNIFLEKLLYSQVKTPKQQRVAMRFH